MKIKFTVLLVLSMVLLSGCVTSLPKEHSRLTTVLMGMSKAQVIKLLGPPAHSTPYHPAAAQTQYVWNRHGSISGPDTSTSYVSGYVNGTPVNGSVTTISGWSSVKTTCRLLVGFDGDNRVVTVKLADFSTPRLCTGFARGG